MEIEKNIQVSVVMGSQSDWQTMQAACDILQKFDVSFEKKIVSAHRTPDRLYEYANSLRKRKSKSCNCWRWRRSTFTGNDCFKN